MATLKAEEQNGNNARTNVQQVCVKHDSKGRSFEPYQPTNQGMHYGN